VFAALADSADAVAWSRRGLFRRIADELGDLQRTRAQLRAVEADMVTVLGELGLARLADIPGLTGTGAAAILAETGDPRRFATARAVVKHAGLAPREKLSGAFTGRTRLTGQGRPGLRLAAWRAVWGAQRANPVYRARYQHLTSREQNKLTPTQAQTIIAAAILRQLHAVITTGQAWDPVTAAHGTRPPNRALAA
jgi:transposase